jgi:H+/gluconate symporter-like permease
MTHPTMSTGAPTPYHPPHHLTANRSGAPTLSRMTDSGFWVVGNLSGFTEKETLKTWTVAVSVNSLSGLLVCLVFSKLIPLI